MGVELDPKINLGHVLIMIGMLGSGIGAYTAARVSLNDQANKIEVIEKTIANHDRIMERQANRLDDMSNNIWGIKQDMAIVRHRVESAGSKP